MTPERHAEIETYVQRLDLDQLPGWTVEQRIIADLWSEQAGTWPHYFSTYCIHDDHDECRLTCKICDEPCHCECHTDGGAS